MDDDTSSEEQMPRPALWKAASKGRAGQVAQLLADGADIEEPGGEKSVQETLTTPLGTAALHGHVQTVLLLLAHGADIFAKNTDGGSPLHDAARSGGLKSSEREKVVKMLLAQGGQAAASAKNNRGESPLHSAAWGRWGGYTDVAKLLLAQGADVSGKASDGWTPLHVTAYKGRQAFVLLLLSHGAGVSAKANDGRTPLHVAAREGREEVVKLLLAHGAGVSEKNNKEETPLHVAAYWGRLAVAQLLVDNGAELSAKDNAGRTPEDVAHSRPRLNVLSNRGPVPTEEGIAAAVARRLAAAAAEQAAIEVMLKAEAVRRAQCEAFAMGLHQRLGAASWVQGLAFEVGVLQMILDLV